MSKNFFFYLLILCISSTTLVGQSDETKSYKPLFLDGSLKIKNKTNFEISECIANATFIMGIESKTASKEDAKDSSFIKGNYQYTYFLDDYTTLAGVISYQFEYIIKNGTVVFKFYNFIHNRGDSEYLSVGIFPANYAGKVKKTFTKEQHGVLLNSIKENMTQALKSINKNCL